MIDNMGLYQSTSAQLKLINEFLIDLQHLAGGEEDDDMGDLTDGQ